jgi:hypothetical protein
MDQNCSLWNESLQKRIELMHELSRSLEHAQAAVLNSDVVELGAQTLRQREICAGWQALISSVAISSKKLAPLKSPDTSKPASTTERRRTLLAELAEVEARVKNLNLEYGALLRRAKRTVDIFCRVLSNAGATYAPPASLGCRRREKG